MSELQIMPPLDDATLAALRASIERHGVLVPVVVDQHGRVIDGHHRQRIADELGIDYPVDTFVVTDTERALELAGHLNLARRHLTGDQRRALAADLRAEGHSVRAIGQALGVSKSQVQRDLEELSQPGQLPERITGLDGKSRPATRPPRDVSPDDEPVVGDEIVLHDGQGDAAIVTGDTEVTARPVTKPDLGGGISHPARFSASLLPIFAEALPPDRYPRVLDPFAGTGRIHQLPNDTVGVEIEPEWAALHPDTIVGSALNLPFENNTFDAVCTSPCYGNRLADHHDANDGSVRRSYTHDLGRTLTPGNAGSLQWGDAYQDFHEQAWAEVWRILRPGGRLVLNIKDHVRDGQRQQVAGWHVTLLLACFTLAWCCDETTGGLRQGENSDARYPEQVFVLDRHWEPPR